jgi:hypothetical protein
MEYTYYTLGVNLIVGTVAKILADMSMDQALLCCFVPATTNFLVESEFFFKLICLEQSTYISLISMALTDTPCFCLQNIGQKLKIKTLMMISLSDYEMMVK